MTPEEKLKELGLELPPLRPSLGDYVRCVRTEIYCSLLGKE